MERIKEGFNILNKAFARLVRRKNKKNKKTKRVERYGWQDACVGWIKRLEVSKGEDGNFHLHVHCLVEGKYLPQSHLAKAWEDCLAKEGWYGCVCDIRSVRGIGGAIEEISKYCFKPLDMTELDLAILSKSFCNRRLYSFGGCWYKVFKGLSRKKLQSLFNDMNGVDDSKSFRCVCGSSSFSVQMGIRGGISKIRLSQMTSRWVYYKGGYYFDPRKGNGDTS